jgi:cell division protein FtsL
MTNLARQLRQEKQQAIKVKKAPKRKLKQTRWLSPGEKILGAAFGLLVCFGSIHIISNQSSIYNVNKEIQDMEQSIVAQEKVNSDLTILISELSQYDRIKEKARQLGLKLNEQNVKVVQE